VEGAESSVGRRNGAERSRLDAVGRWNQYGHRLATKRGEGVKSEQAASFVTYRRALHSASTEPCGDLGLASTRSERRAKG